MTMITIKARVCYRDFQSSSKVSLALRMKHAFEAQGIRFAPLGDERDPHEEPAPLPPFRMIQSGDGERLFIEQDQDVDA